MVKKQYIINSHKYILTTFFNSTHRHYQMLEKIPPTPINNSRKCSTHPFYSPAPFVCRLRVVGTRNIRVFYGFNLLIICCLLPYLIFFSSCLILILYLNWYQTPRSLIAASCTRAHGTKGKRTCTWKAKWNSSATGMLLYTWRLLCKSFCHTLMHWIPFQSLIFFEYI